MPVAVAPSWLVALAGWGLRTWGPINPAVTMVSGQQSIDESGVWTASVLVSNEARAPIEIVAVSTSLESPAGASGVAEHRVTDVSISEETSDGGWVLASRPVPAPVPGGDRALVTATLSGDMGCAPGIGLMTFDLRVTYRTESGRTVTRVVPVPRADLPACAPPLPTGPQPADAVAAGASVRSAFDVVYDPTAGAARLDLLDDPRGVADTTAAAIAGPYGSEVASTTATFGEVSFDRPDHAWFHYELSVGFGTRTGEAVLVDGKWKIARSTVCADLALAGVTCPPVPALTTLSVLVMVRGRQGPADHHQNGGGGWGQMILSWGL